MLRVLMVLEDYGELMFLQTVLKKLGFDVDSIQNPRQFGDSILRMNPDFLVMTAHGKKVRGDELVRNVRRVRGLPRVILLRGPRTPQDPDLNVDGWLESPVAAMTLLNLIADLAGLNKQVLAEKFQKLHMADPAAEKIRELSPTEEDQSSLERSALPSVHFGQLESSSLSNADRMARYQKFLDEKPPEEHGFASKQVAEQVRNLRDSEKSEDLEELERQRKAFVEHLFNKKN